MANIIGYLDLNKNSTMRSDTPIAADDYLREKRKKKSNGCFQNSLDQAPSIHYQTIFFKNPDNLCAQQCEKNTYSAPTINHILKCSCYS